MFPYAGGGASVFQRFVADVGHEEWLDVAVVQLPGRAGRLDEPAYADMEALLDALEPVLLPLLGVPFILLGYSMGATIAYELAVRFAQIQRTPRHLILAARRPPYRWSVEAAPGVPTAEDVVGKIRRLGATAPDLIDSSLFRTHFVPTLQADFALVDGYARFYPHVLPCPVLACGASDDPDVTVADIEAWRAAAGGPFASKLFTGGHFFLHSAHAQLLARIDRVLAGYA